MIVLIFHDNPENNQEHGFFTENVDIIALAKIEAEEVITESSKRWPVFGDEGEDMSLRLGSVEAVKHYAEMDNIKLNVIN
jgi:hypothetical protein